jgi:tetratricopeptide (TPR) repeat protein
LIGFCPAEDATIQNSQDFALNESSIQQTNERQLYDPFDGSSMAGNYLASRFAQRHHDWSRSSKYLNKIVKNAPENPDIAKRAMVLLMGSGQPERATEMAVKVAEQDPESTLARLFIAIDTFKKQDYENAAKQVGNMPGGGLSDFIMPLLGSWSLAAVGEKYTDSLNNSTIHVYHSILIADFMKDHADIESRLEQVLVNETIAIDDLERIADIYGHIGKTDKALELYQRILSYDPNYEDIAEKAAKLKAGQDVKLFETVKTPEEGVAIALYDMARMLYQDYSDESARVFSHMALYLAPDFSEASLLLAHINARNERYGEAIEHYLSVMPDHKAFVNSRRLAAELMEENGRTEEALQVLAMLVNDYDDMGALIQIGDIHRRSEEFAKAVQTYNQVEEKLGDAIPAEYWRIHYVRGMSYEQIGQWDKAEKDLKTALEFQPDHPFVLNYLGYAWADQGINLKQSLEMIKKAVSLQPTDGYITDSLGWVLYRMGDYKNAVPYLERAVELLPYDPVINDHLGDAYWRVGRKLEARFQWMRAQNHSDDETLLQTISAKLEDGLNTLPIVKEARTISDDTKLP